MSEASRIATLRHADGRALTYLLLLLAIPLVMIFVKTFENGISEPLDSITSPDGLHAFWMTIVCVGIAVPLNTIFGILCALMLVRQDFWGKGIINSLIDLPFAVSPVVIGLALFLVYGADGFIGGPLDDAGIQIIFSTPGLVLATIFVSLPVRGARGDARAAGDRRRPGAGRDDARVALPGRRSGRSPCRRSAGA